MDSGFDTHLTLQLLGATTVYVLGFSRTIELLLAVSQTEPDPTRSLIPVRQATRLAHSTVEPDSVIRSAHPFPHLRREERSRTKLRF